MNKQKRIKLTERVIREYFWKQERRYNSAMPRMMTKAMFKEFYGGKCAEFLGYCVSCQAHALWATSPTITFGEFYKRIDAAATLAWQQEEKERAEV